MPPEASALRRARVTGLDAHGDGVVVVDRQPLAVAGVIPGERVTIQPAGRRAARGLLVAVDEPSPARQVPRCQHAGTCGGCSWQHMAYPEQLRLKRQSLQQALDAALGPGTARVPALDGMPCGEASVPWGFRHKVHFAFDQQPGHRVVMGHLRPRSREVFDARECPVHAEAGNAVAFAVKDALRRANVRCGPPPDGLVRHIVSRVGRGSGEVIATLVVTANDTTLRRVSRMVLGGPARPDGWHLNLHPRPGPWLFGEQTLHLDGRARVREDLGGVTFLISPTAFFQTNVEAAVLLVDHVLGGIPADGRPVLDVYAGLGLFALPLAARGHPVTAIEESPSATLDGRASARASGIPPERCRFLNGRAEDLLRRLVRQRADFASVVIDPPRAGARGEVIDAIAEGLAPRRILYVSCDTQALARDLARVLRRGRQHANYRLTDLRAIDMFPHTPHVEVVARLEATGRDTTARA